MSFENKLRKVLFEGSGLAPADPGSGAGGGKVGFNVNQEDKKSALRSKDARRKRRERKRDKSKSKKPEDFEQEEVDVRENMQGTMKLTLKEMFLKNILEYVTTRKSKPIRDALELMEEYPKLKRYVKEQSVKKLPPRKFAVYSARESTMNEEVGKPSYRSGGKTHNWCLNQTQAPKNYDISDSYYVMEAKILPNHVLLYIPAFSKDMENFIFSGKIEEPEVNPVRLLRQQNEVILPSNIDTGLIVEVH